MSGSNHVPNLLLRRSGRRNRWSVMVIMLHLAVHAMMYPSCEASQWQRKFRYPPFHVSKRKRINRLHHQLPLAFTPPALIDSALMLPQDGAAIWLARFASATLTYAGLVVALDRPRGSLHVKNSVRIADSQVKGAGLGLFCTKSMKDGTVLGTYPGAVLPLEQNLDKLKRHPECEAYVWRFSDNKLVIDPTNSKGKIEAVCKGGNPSTFGSTWLMENLLGMLVQVPSTLCRINEPPPGSSVNVIIDEDLEQRTITLALARNVYEGEELFMDYGVSYDRSKYRMNSQ